MSPKTGRPHSDNPRQMRVETKMTTAELERLDYCCKVSGKSRSEIIREGIDVVYAKRSGAPPDKARRHFPQTNRCPKTHAA